MGKHDKLKGLMAGVLLGSMITGATAYASSGTNIQVFFENIRYMVDGNQKTPAADQKGFVYKGTTYVPLRFASESLGKDVSWDGKNKTVWIGKKLGAFKDLTALHYARYDVYGSRIAINGTPETYEMPTGMTMTGTQYSKGIALKLDGGWHDELSGSIDYNLDGQYTKMTALVGVDDATQNSTSIGTVTFLGDGKEIAKFSNLKGGDHPTEANIDLTGVLKLQIKSEVPAGGDYLVVDIAEEPKVFQ